MDPSGSLIMRVGSQDFLLGAFELPVEVVAEVEKTPDLDPRSLTTSRTPDMNVTTIARVCHEANRVLQIAANEAPSPHWDDAPDWQRESVIQGVQAALAGATPQELHERWRERKTAEGWVYGPVKDDQARTHPCLLPYELLPQSQRTKDHLFHAIVRAFRTASPAAPEG